MKSESILIRLLVLCFVSTFTCSELTAQNYEVFSFNSTMEPSVESFSIAQYGKLEPSLYTGTMSYSVPLYTYSDPDFTLPISLDYSFNGYRPAVHSGSVGYGWALNCGGIITRDIKGMADDANDPESNTSGYYRAIEHGIFEDVYEIVNSKQFFLSRHVGTESELGNVNVFSDRPTYVREHKVGPRYDTCPDIFHFNFLGYSGDFMLTKDGSIKVFNCNRPAGELTVECTFTNPDPFDNSFSEIRIKTGDGYTYYFGGTYKNLEFSRTKAEGSFSPDTISGWKLRKIVAPNSKTMEFIYDEVQKDRSIFLAFTPSINTIITVPGAIGGGDSQSETIKYTNTTYHSLLSEVRVNDERIVQYTYSEKDYTENDQDNFDNNLSNLSDPHVFGLPQTELRLENIWVGNPSGQTVESIDLYHSYQRGNTARMFLSEVTSMKNGAHSFEYNTRIGGLPSNDTYATDHWGYWNGQSGSYNVKHYITNITLGQSDLYNQLSSSYTKAANEEYSKVGGLSKITYPTGGYSNIHYEANVARYRINSINDFDESQEGYKTGGVRVSKIENISNDISDYTEYTYQDGILMYMPKYATKLEYRYYTEFYSESGDNEVISGYADVTAFGFTEDCNFAVMRGPHMAYAVVTATYPDRSYTTYRYCNAMQHMYRDNKHYEYDHFNDVYNGIKVHQKDSYFSETDFITSNYDNHVRNQIRYIFMPNINDYSSIRGKLESIEEYDADEILKRKTINSYRLILEHSDTLIYNTLLDFTEAPLRLYVPQLAYDMVIEYYGDEEISSFTNYDYNAKGQTVAVNRIIGDDRESENYRYYWETAGNNGAESLQNVVTNYVQTKEDHIVSGITFQYTDSYNPQPSSALHYSSDSPVLEGSDIFLIPSGYETLSVNYLYDATSHRLIKESFPGNRYCDYVWDSNDRNILSVENSHPDNVTEYTWKDMVGITEIKYPTQVINYFVYDANNRLFRQRDKDLRTMKEYRYDLMNK